MRKSDGKVTSSLQVILQNNQLLLSTPSALYSEGIKYEPASKFLKKVKNRIPTFNNVLILGTGLSSITRIINKQGHYPNFTLVDIDEVILKWAIEFAEPGSAKKMIPVCQDAKQFMNQNKNKYDMIFVDVFLGRVVPDFVTNKDFLLQCRNSLLPDGCIGLNYIINDEDEWATVQATFASIFPVYEVVSFNINRVFVATYV